MTDIQLQSTIICPQCHQKTISMITPIIIVTRCIVNPLALLGIPFIYSKRTKKRKAWEEEREKIKAYGEEINEETRNKDKWKTR